MLVFKCSHLMLQISHDIKTLVGMSDVPTIVARGEPTGIRGNGKLTQAAVQDDSHENNTCLHYSPRAATKQYTYYVVR